MDKSENHELLNRIIESVMACLRPVVLGIFLSCIINPVLCQNTADPREALIQNALKNLLGVGEGAGRDLRGHPLPPKYMMHLYERFRSGQAVMRGNTVRSILPMKGTVGGVDMLMFNLTGINPNEQILQSKLYLLKRRRRKKGKDNSHFRLKISDSSLPNQWVEISLPRQGSSEWHSYDITEAVVRCRQAKIAEHLLTVTAEVRRPRGDFRHTTFKRILKSSSQPFVLIFSEDHLNQTDVVPKNISGSAHEEIGDLIRARDGPDEKDSVLESHPRWARSTLEHQEGVVDSSGADVNETNLVRLVLLEFEAAIKNIVPNQQIPVTVLGSHEKLTSNHKEVNIDRYRKLFGAITDIASDAYSPAIDGNNEMQSTFKKYLEQLIAFAMQSSNSTLAEWPLHKSKRRLEALAKRLQGLFIKTISDHVRSKRSVHSYSMIPKDVVNSDVGLNRLEVIEPTHISDTRPFHHQRKRHRTGQRRYGKRKKERKHRKLPVWWTNHKRKFHAQDFERMCQRKSLAVDFNNIGWGEWIISPKSFNAYYCDGSCSFPLITDTKHSNHAVIQSLIHALGTNMNVPSPCCIPSAMNSLTLLYFDQNNGVVLKNFPNMIVEKCACV